MDLLISDRNRGNPNNILPAGSSSQPTLADGKGKFRQLSPGKQGTTPEGSDGNVPPKRIACVECRQQKVII